MNNYNTLTITMKDGETAVYHGENDEWDDYEFMGNAFAVKRKGAWIGIYNFDSVRSVVLK